jgi:signal peptidase I
MTGTVLGWRRRVGVWIAELRPLVLTVLFMIAAETAIAQPFIVPSGSMEPTLLIGDEILASKFAYGYTRYSLPFGPAPDLPGTIAERAPERGDVVVFRLPRDPSETYVKRVIGLPGDRIQMKEGNLSINGELVPRRQIGTFAAMIGGRPAALARYVETLPNGRTHEIIKISDRHGLNDTPEFRVPPGEYFMMGDNRDNSTDSRVPRDEGGVGFVPAENLVGRADRVLFSITPIGQWLEVLKHPADLRISRLLNAVD